MCLSVHHLSLPQSLDALRQAYPIRLLACGTYSERRFAYQKTPECSSWVPRSCKSPEQYAVMLSASQKAPVRQIASSSVVMILPSSWFRAIVKEAVLPVCDGRTVCTLEKGYFEAC